MHDKLRYAVRGQKIYAFSNRVNPDQTNTVGRPAVFASNLIFFQNTCARNREIYPIKNKQTKKLGSICPFPNFIMRSSIALLAVYLASNPG